MSKGSAEDHFTPTHPVSLRFKSRDAKLELSSLPSMGHVQLILHRVAPTVSDTISSVQKMPSKHLGEFLKH